MIYDDSDFVVRLLRFLHRLSNIGNNIEILIPKGNRRSVMFHYF